ncbi:MAG: hypothetical protein ABW116_06390 [Candidatus Sedimenticola sp. 20ELBAFRAG]
MKRLIALAVISLAAVAVAQPVSADGRHGHGKLKEVAKLQQKQIRKGVKRGDLTQREAQKLKRQQKRIKKMHRRYMDDGWLSRYERRELRSAYRKAGERIDRLRNNDNYRFYRVRITGHGRNSPFGGSKIGYWYPQEQRLVFR